MTLHNSIEFINSHTYDGFDFQKSIVGKRHFLERLRTHATTSPERTFVTHIDPTGHSDVLTYEELWSASLALGAWLLRNKVAKPDDIVAILVQNDVASIVMFFGALQAGFSLLLLNPKDPPRRSKEIIDSVSACRLILPHSLEFDLGDFPTTTLPYYKNLEREPEQRLEPSFNLYFATSGSTASSKIVEQSQYNAIVNAEALIRHHSLKESDTILGCLPIHHVNGLHFTILASLAAGAHTVLMQQFNPTLYLKVWMAYKPRIASVVPSILDIIFCILEKDLIPPNFDYFVSAAAPMRKETCLKAWRTFGIKIMQGYGLTETTNFSATLPTNLSDESYENVMLKGDLPSIGVALFGNEMGVFDKDGRQLKDGEVGEICIRGHNVMTGYYQNAQSTLTSLRNGWFHTQDLGYTRFDELSGQTFYYISGREKNIAKVFGIAVSLEEMERYITNHPNTKDAACAAIKNTFMGEEVIVLIDLKEKMLWDEGAMKVYLEKCLPREVIPQKFISIDSIPRTATGKILRPEVLRLVTEAIS